MLLWFLGWEDPLEEEMATHSDILAWKIPWTEKPHGLQPLGSQESDMTEQLSTHTYSNSKKKKTDLGKISQNHFLLQQKNVGF